MEEAKIYRPTALVEALHDRLGYYTYIHNGLLMPQGICKIGVSEPVPRGKQLGRLGAPAGQSKLLTHFTHDQTHNELWHDAARLEAQCLCRGRGKPDVA